MKRRLAQTLRTWADRLDYPGSLRISSYSFTIERGEGIRFREDGRGCRLYLFDGEHHGQYGSAHTEADNPS